MCQKLYSMAIAIIFMAFFIQVKSQLSCSNVTGLNANESNIFGQWIVVEIDTSAALQPGFVNVACAEVNIGLQNATNLTANILYSYIQNNHNNFTFTAEANNSVNGAYGYNFSYTPPAGSLTSITIKFVNVTNNFTLLCGYQQSNASNSFGVILSRNITYNQTDLTAMQTDSASKYNFGNGLSLINKNQGVCFYSAAPLAAQNSGYRMLPGVFAVLIFMYSILNYTSN